DRAIVVGDDALHDVQPESRTLSRGFGCEMRLEDAGGDGRGYAWTGVADLDAKAAILLRRADHDAPFPVVFRSKCVRGIVEKVGPELVKLGAVSLDRRQRAI